MEPWQKLTQALCEIWVQDDLKAGKINNEESTENNNDKEKSDGSEEYHAAA